MAKFIQIPDNKVVHIWANPDGTGEIEVTPDWYQDNGTPVCDCDSDFDGEDMIYVRTEILTEDEGDSCSCGHKFGPLDIDGGRCIGCGTMIVLVYPE